MKHDLEVTLDELIRDLRVKADLTQKQLADAVGVSPGYIARIETGNSSVGETNLRRIADAVDASTAERKRLAKARDRASERLSTRRERPPTDLGQRPVSVDDSSRPALDALAPAGNQDSEDESLRQEVEGLAHEVERLSKMTEENRKRLGALERQARQSRQAGG